MKGSTFPRLVRSPWMQLVLVWLTLVAGAAAAQSGNFCLVRTAALQGSYDGDCVAGYASGRGRAKGVDTYEGGFRDGQPTGSGIYIFADGRRFDGEFLDGKVNGRARFTYASGDVLDGVFRDNVLSGTGRMQRINGQILQVQLQGGAMVVVAEVPAAAAPPPQQVQPTGGGSASLTPGGPESGSATSPVRWSPQMDLEDFFPAYLLSIASINQHAGASAGQSRSSRSAFAAGADLTGMSVPSPPNLMAQSRMIGSSTKNYQGDPWGLVGVRVNSTQAGTVVDIKLTVDEIAEPTEARFTLGSPGEHDLFPRVRYRYDRLRTVLQPFPVNVSWQISINGRPAETQTRTVRVRSVQDAPLAAETGRGVEDLAWVFAGFVTEDAAWIDDLLKAAFAGQKQSAYGYQGDEAAVHKQVAIIYEHLRRTGVRYSSITSTSGTSKKVISQIVRFPSDSVRTAQANCIDGTVLMASILRKIDIEPIIITGPGHAMLGYYPQRDPAKGFMVVETTALEIGDFAFALEKGMARYKDWASNHAKSPSFKRIPVFAARALGVMPIPR